MDEPASALDPIATQRIEELIYDLKKGYTIVIVTHNMQQAARVSDYTAFFWLGQARRVRAHRKDLHGSRREADRRLRHGTVRLGGHGRWNASFGISRRSSNSLKARLLEMGGLAEERVRRAVKGLVERDHELIERVLAGDEPINALHIEIDDRCFKLLALHQPMAADLRADHRGGEDQHRPRARRRPGGEHRRGGQALRDAPAGQEADRHPADGGYRAGDAARRAGRLRPPRRRRWRSRCCTRTTRWTRSRRRSSASC